MMPTTGTPATLDGHAEESLVARARLGDESAIRMLVQQNNRRLYRVARAVLGDDVEAEDVVQEAYFRAFRSISGFRGESGFATWLTRIALNEALQRLRGRRRKLASPERSEVAGSSGAEIINFPGVHHSSDPESAAARHQLREVIDAAVERLPRPLRIVFILRDVEELSISETAVQLGLRPATVKTRLHRARKQLRNHLHADIAATLSGTFPFAGARCARMADRVVQQLRSDGRCLATARSDAVGIAHQQHSRAPGRNLFHRAASDVCPVPHVRSTEVRRS